MPIVFLYISVLLYLSLSSLFLCKLENLTWQHHTKSNVSVCLSTNLSVCLSVYLSVCLSVYLSVCLSVSHYLHLSFSIFTSNLEDFTNLSLCLSLLLYNSVFPVSQSLSISLSQHLNLKI